MKPEHYAIDLLDGLKINSFPVNPFEIATRLGIHVIEDDAKGYDGLLLKMKEGSLISINKKIINIGRKHFTLAHELGHYSIPTHSGNEFGCFPNPVKHAQVIENEANIFASELLLPARLIKPMLHTYKPDFENIGELAADYGTSLTATAIKYVAHTEDCCALISTSENRIIWFQKSSSFPFWIEHGALISAGTLTASYSLRGIEQEVASEKVHATYWVKGRGIDNSTSIIESCVPMPDYGVVLTMLWFPDPPFYISGYGDDDEEYRYEEDKNTWRWRDPDE